MDETGDATPEHSLDPEDWDAARAVGHRMIDDLVAFLSEVRARPAWRPVPADVDQRLGPTPPPRTGLPLGDLYDEVRRDVMPWPTGNIHPRFWGWVMGTGTVAGVYGDLLAAAMNSSAAGFDDAAPRVEAQLLGWLRELMGFPEGASGLLVTGGSMANLVGLTVARNERAGFDVRAQGLAGGPPLVVYASSEAHSSVRKAVELLGLGTAGLRLVPVDAHYRIDVGVLANAIAADRAAGRRPIAVVGNAGAVGTGATDDLTALADLCAREELWFHVDGAFGALAMLSSRLRPQVAGLERADSVAFDLHKWGWVPYDCGVVLVRDAAAHRHAFTVTPAYLSPLRGGTAPGTLRFSEYGVQLSRSFRALKAWMTVREHGVDALVRILEQNVDQAAFLAARVRQEPELELMAEAPLNVVCFRYARGTDLDTLNRELLVRLQESGLAVPSHTLLGGRFALRVAITNHRSRREDFTLLVDAVLRLGHELTAAGREVA